MKTVKIVQDPEQPVEREILARQIGAMADAFVKLLNQGITRRGLVVLIQDAAPYPLTKKDVNAVLDALKDLRRLYVAAPEKGKKA